MRWLVDGMNVIGSRPSGWWRDRPKAMRELAEELAAFAERGGGELTVVFDGAPVEIEARPGVEVRFAKRRGRNAADDDIAAIVERDASPAEITVVSSDSELVRRVKAAGAQAMGAGSFRRRLEADDS